MLWSPTEICNSILRHVTPRQITDLAELRIIHPVKDSPGRGVPRIYDFNGVFDIAVACALRSLLPPHLVREILEALRNRLEEAAKGERDPWDLFIIKRSEKGGRIGTAVVAFDKLHGESLRWRDEEERPEGKVYRSRRERLERAGGPVIQAVPLDWPGGESKEVSGGGACDPMDHRLIILNISDLRREISAAIEKG